MEQFAYWDTAKNDYTDTYKNWVSNITEQDVKDIYSGKYGDMSTYLSKNQDYIPTVDEAKALMTDKKYGDWHKIGQAYVQARSNDIPDKYKQFDPNRIKIENPTLTVNTPGIDHKASSWMAPNYIGKNVGFDPKYRIDMRTDK
jgi:hypothetical protein